MLIKIWKVIYGAIVNALVNCDLILLSHRMTLCIDVIILEQACNVSHSFGMLMPGS